MGPIVEPWLHFTSSAYIFNSGFEKYDALSDNSSYFSKPELKIYADDVKCSHGSTIGPIDENAIFYLRSRGMSKIAATKILISSFINEELNSIDNEQMSEIIQKKLVRYLSKVKWIFQI